MMYTLSILALVGSAALGTYTYFDSGALLSLPVGATGRNAVLCRLSFFR